jgi:hypothetical protein
MPDHITGNTTFKTISITVAPDGTSRVETSGFAGSECREASRFAVQALGNTLSEQLKPEFHQTTTTKQQARQGH